MRHHVPIALLMVSILYSPSLRAESPYIGSWVMKNASIEITVESWGKDCGTKPASKSSSASYTVEIREQAGHLIFSKGNLRTDTCGSPNPKVQSVLAKRTTTYWKRVCQTAEDDPKFEKGEYILNAADDNRLEYSAVSKFNWNINGNHCAATSTERRTYTRTPATNAGASPSAAPKSEADSKNGNEPAVHSSKEDAAINEGCEFLGPAVRVDIFPKKVEVGPGGRVCLTAIAYDHKGCKVTAGNKFTWSATQDEMSFSRLISQNGCFWAGETAADSEGVYQVSAHIAGKVATAEVTVNFHDLGNLIAARLDPLSDDATAATDVPFGAGQSKIPPKETPSMGEATPAAAGPQAASAVLSDRQGGVGVSVPPEESHFPLLSVFGFIGIAAVGVALWIYFRIRRRPSAPMNGPAKKNSAALVCPSCGRTFDSGSNFCPYDKTSLRSSLSSPSAIPTGMICPKCHRGYDADARFCPHDANGLVPYSEWRLSRMPPPP